MNGAPADFTEIFWSIHEDFVHAMYDINIFYKDTFLTTGLVLQDIFVIETWKSSQLKQINLSNKHGRKQYFFTKLSTTYL